MRNFIFEFDQQHAVKLGLNTDELLLLDYFYKFFQEGRARYVFVGADHYYLIRYSKILADLPILGSSDKTIRRMVAELERKQILRRHIKNRRDLFIFVNWKKAFGQEDDDGQNVGEIFIIDGQKAERDDVAMDNADLPHGQNRAAIDSYNNKLKIITNNTRAKELDRALLLREIRKQIAAAVHSSSFDLWYKNIAIVDITDTFIEFAFPTEMAVGVAKKESQLSMLEAVVNKAVGLFVA